MTALACCLLFLLLCSTQVACSGPDRKRKNGRVTTESKKIRTETDATRPPQRGEAELNAAQALLDLSLQDAGPTPIRNSANSAVPQKHDGYAIQDSIPQPGYNILQRSPPKTKRIFTIRRASTPFQRPPQQTERHNASRVPQSLPLVPRIDISHQSVQGYAIQDSIPQPGYNILQGSPPKTKRRFNREKKEIRSKLEKLLPASQQTELHNASRVPQSLPLVPRTDRSHQFVQSSSLRDIGVPLTTYIAQNDKTIDVVHELQKVDTITLSEAQFRTQKDPLPLPRVQLVQDPYKTTQGFPALYDDANYLVSDLKLKHLIGKVGLDIKKEATPAQQDLEILRILEQWPEEDYKQLILGAKQFTQGKVERKDILKAWRLQKIMAAMRVHCEGYEQTFERVFAITGVYIMREFDLCTFGVSAYTCGDHEVMRLQKDGFGYGYALTSISRKQAVYDVDYTFIGGFIMACSMARAKMITDSNLHEQAINNSRDGPYASTDYHVPTIKGGKRVAKFQRHLFGKYINSLKLLCLILMELVDYIATQK